ncbi:MAG: radical SAM protein [Chloroflexi bacterium]|nr:radical SAM protein [Chloroflexota bacterium]
MAKTTEGKRLREIEAYFQKYPNVPREIIVKADLLNLGHSFSDAALEAASGALVKSYRLFSYDLMTMAQMERREFAKVPEWFTIFQGDYGLRPVTVQTTLATDSPYLVDVIDGRLGLRLDGHSIASVSYPRPFAYYARSFPDGTAYRDVIAFGAFVTIFRACQYWGVKEECKFCDINENARQMKETQSYTLSAPVKTVEQIAEVAREIGREAASAGYPTPVRFILTGGTITTQLHGKAEDDFYLEYAQAVKGSGHRLHVTLQTNAKDLATLKRYRSGGVDSHHANMEVWDERLFPWVCPGKARRVGRDAWIRSMLDSVDVFGEGVVRPNFVCGVEMARPNGFATVEEAVRSTTEGIEFLMSHGVVPRFNHWRREPRAYLAREHVQPPPPLDFYIQLMRNRYEVWKKHALPLPYSYGPHPEVRYMGAAHGTYDDYVLLTEKKDYAQQAMAALQDEKAIIGLGLTFG